MSDCRFGVLPVNYPDPDPDDIKTKKTLKYLSVRGSCRSYTSGMTESGICVGSLERSCQSQISYWSLYTPV